MPKQLLDRLQIPARVIEDALSSRVTRLVHPLAAPRRLADDTRALKTAVPPVVVVQAVGRPSADPGY
jgi:hypothetical protein